METNTKTVPHNLDTIFQHHSDSGPQKWVWQYQKTALLCPPTFYSLSCFNHGSQSILNFLRKIYFTRSENRGKSSNQLLVYEGTTLKFQFSKIGHIKMWISGIFFCVNPLELKSTLVIQSKKCKIPPINDDGYKTAQNSATAHCLIVVVSMICTLIQHQKRTPNNTE